MKRNKDKFKFKGTKGGYVLLTALLAVAIFSVLVLKARTMWETEIRRDFEQELLFRARQYVNAIELFRLKNNNLFPQNLDDLFEKKFLRKRFKDPMSLEGKWNVVMQQGSPEGGQKALLIVPEENASDYISQATIIGVCSTSCDEGYLVYRKKKKYCEWAIYLGEQADKEMPELKFIAAGDSIEDSGRGRDGGSKREDDRGGDEEGGSGDDERGNEEPEGDRKGGDR